MQPHMLLLFFLQKYSQHLATRLLNNLGGLTIHPCLYRTAHMQHLLLFPKATGELMKCLVYKNDWMTFNPTYINFNTSYIHLQKTIGSSSYLSITMPKCMWQTLTLEWHKAHANRTFGKLVVLVALFESVKLLRKRWRCLMWSASISSDFLNCPFMHSRIADRQIEQSARDPVVLNGLWWCV